MKTLLLPLIVCGAALLSFSQTQAATAYGGFSPGLKFTLTVKSRVSKALVGTSTKPKTVAVPSDVPDYKLGQKVTFTIGAKGQLIAMDGLSLPFKSDKGSANAYYKKTDSSHPQGDIGEVFKVANKPTAANLLFVRAKVSGVTPTSITVGYWFE